MTILNGLLKRANVEDPNVPLASIPSWGSFVGARGQDVPVVSEDRAYGLTAYLRAVALISGTIAALPFKVYKDGTRTRQVDPKALSSPNAAQTRFEFRQTILANALTWGTGYAWKYRNRAGGIVGLASIHSSRVLLEQAYTPTPTDDGLLFHIVDPKTGRRQTYTSRDVFHLPYLSPHGGAGLSPLALANRVLGISVAAEETSGKFYANGTFLSGILTSKNELDQKQAEALKARWNEKVRGANTAGEIAVLDNDTTFTPLTVPPADAQTLESRKFGVTEIARLFGVPPHLLMDVEKSTSWGTGIEQQTLGFVQYTLQPWLTLIEQRVTREILPPGQFGEHSLEGLLRGDSAARSAIYHSAIIDGWMTRNEVRRLENLEPGDSLDDFLVPSNLTLISVDGQLQPLGGTNAPAPQGDISA